MAGRVWLLSVAMTSRLGATPLVRRISQPVTTLASHKRQRAIVTAGAAHALRAPLPLLKGRLHAMEDGIIDPSPEEAGRLLRQVEQLLRIVDDLGMMARAEAERREIELPPWLSAG